MAKTKATRGRAVPATEVDDDLTDDTIDLLSEGLGGRIRDLNEALEHNKLSAEVLTKIGLHVRAAYGLAIFGL